MKTAEEILATAPRVKILPDDEGDLIALVCKGNCTWWTNDAKDCRIEGERLRCAACGGSLREVPLEALIAGNRQDNQKHFEMFIRAFAGNRR